MNALILTVSDLFGRTAAELDALYTAAAAPDTAELDGDYDGVLLTGHFPGRGRPFSIGFINRSWLPWRGKSFSAARGRGANRLSLAGWRGAIWPFDTRVVDSPLDGADTLWIDYDLAGNPGWLRRGVFDELRRLRDGLYLGKGGLRLGGRDLFQFHWALTPG